MLTTERLSPGPLGSRRKWWRPSWTREGPSGSVLRAAWKVLTLSLVAGLDGGGRWPARDKGTAGDARIAAVAATIAGHAWAAAAATSSAKQKLVRGGGWGADGRAAASHCAAGRTPLAGSPLHQRCRAAPVPSAGCAAGPSRGRSSEGSGPTWRWRVPETGALPSTCAAIGHAPLSRPPAVSPARSRSAELRGHDRPRSPPLRRPPPPR